MANGRNASISTSEFLAELEERLKSAEASPDTKVMGAADIRRMNISVGATKAAARKTAEPTDVELAMQNIRSAIKNIQTLYLLPSAVLEEKALQMLHATIRTRLHNYEDDKDLQSPSMYGTLLIAADHIKAIGQERLDMDDKAFELEPRDYAIPRTGTERPGLRTGPRDYPEGIPAEMSKKVAGEHERALLAHRTHRLVKAESLLVRDSAKLLNPDNPTALAPETLPTVLSVFRVAVGEQFRTTVGYMSELNRIFEPQQSGRTNLLCWTEYGFELFQQFYTNYCALQDGAEIEELLPRLSHATAIERTVDEAADKLDWPVIARLRFSRPSKPAGPASEAYRKVPAPRPEEITEGKLTGLADLSTIDEDVSIADWDDNALVILANEVDEVTKAEAKEIVAGDTLRVSKTMAYIELPLGSKKYALAEKLSGAVQAFKLAVLREAGSKLAGMRELEQMFSACRMEKGNAVIAAWTPQGLHKFQVFLPRYVEEMKVEHPELELPQSRDRRYEALGIEDEDFDGVRQKTGGASRTPAAREPLIGRLARSTATDAARVINIGYTGPQGHLSETVYPYNAANHFTLAQLTAHISKRLGFEFNTTQISHRINRRIEEHVQEGRKSARPAKQDVYVQMADTTDPYPIYYTQAAATAVVDSIVRNPPQEFRIAQRMDKGEGVDSINLAADLGISPDAQRQFDTDLLKLVDSLPLSMRGSIRLRVDSAVLETLMQEGILDSEGVNFERASETYNGEYILQEIRAHFASGVANYDAFNELKNQYFDLGYTALPLQGVRLNGSESASGINLEGYDFRDCDLSNADLTFCNISQAYLDSTTILEGAKMDSSTVANKQQRDMHGAQQQRTNAG